MFVSLTAGWRSFLLYIAGGEVALVPAVGLVGNGAGEEALAELRSDTISCILAAVLFHIGDKPQQFRIRIGPARLPRMQIQSFNLP